MCGGFKSIPSKVLADQERSEQGQTPGNGQGPCAQCDGASEPSRASLNQGGEEGCRTRCGSKTGSLNSEDARNSRTRQKVTAPVYELVRERSIVQSYQFAKVAEKQVRHHGTTFDRILMVTEAMDGRPTFEEMTKAFGEGYNLCWLYTQVDDEPELVDSIALASVA